MAVTLVIRMAHVVFLIRMLVGATLVLFGLNDLMELFEVDYGSKANAFLQDMEGSGYLQEVRGGLLILCGIMFVIARWVPLALILFAPIILNILVFHAFLAPTKIAAAAALGVAQVFLAYCYWPYFRSVFVMNTPSRYGTVRRRGGGGMSRPAAASAQRPPAQRPQTAQRPPSAQRPSSAQRPTP